MHGITDSLYVKELAKKTHRGLEGKFLKGLSAGGRCFGYDSVLAEGGTRWIKNEREAAIVNEIFEMSASGWSLKRIAGELNSRGVPPPRKRSDRTHPTWCPSAIREMLRRELYVGRRIWNQRKWVKTPGTNKRVSRLRSQNEWKIQELPDLRIVNDDLWKKVHERQERVKEIYGNSGRKPVNRASSSAYLFSGFLKCSECGANLIIVSGGAAGARYGCPQHWNRGACSNRFTVKNSEVESELLGGLQVEVLRDDAVEAVVQGALQALKRQRASEDRSSRILILDGEIRKLIGTIARVEDPETMLSELNSRQRELRELKAAQEISTTLSEEEIRSRVQKALTDLPALLKKDPALAKSKLSEHLSPVRLSAQPDGKFIAEGEWDHLGNRGPVMVAGVGFEPTTFGL